jgi:hypothetical protein
MERVIWRILTNTPNESATSLLGVELIIPQYFAPHSHMMCVVMYSSEPSSDRYYAAMVRPYIQLN